MFNKIFSIIFFLFSFSAAQSEPTETEQDRLYIQCLIKNKVTPKEIPTTINHQCLSFAGINDPGDTLRKTTGDAWRGCLVKRVVQIDDGISPASEVSMAILSSCTTEWRNYVNSFYMHPAAKHEMASDIVKHASNEGIQATLLVRKVKRSEQSQDKLN
jgi:hypothetical protein